MFKTYLLMKTVKADHLHKKHGYVLFLFPCSQTLSHVGHLSPAWLHLKSGAAAASAFRHGRVRRHGSVSEGTDSSPNRRYDWTRRPGT